MFIVQYCCLYSLYCALALWGLLITHCKFVSLNNIQPVSPPLCFTVSPLENQNSILTPSTPMDAGQSPNEPLLLHDSASPHPIPSSIVPTQFLFPSYLWRDGFLPGPIFTSLHETRFEPASPCYNSNDTFITWQVWVCCVKNNWEEPNTADFNKRTMETIFQTNKKKTSVISS